MFDFIQIAQAATGELPRSIVPPCGPTGTTTKIIDGVTKTLSPCGMDDLVALGVNIVNTLIAIGILVTILFIIIGGVRMMISSGNPEKIQQARANITSALIGIVIILTAWVVINTTLTLLTNCTGEWYIFGNFVCG